MRGRKFLDRHIAGPSREKSEDQLEELSHRRRIKERYTDRNGIAV